jgi:glutamate N-acetyltransferase/amino-acid N-acetyltransferase
MPTTQLSFQSRAEHRDWLSRNAALPRGFRVGTSSLTFVPVEAPKPGRMNLSLIALDRPTDAFAAKFTRNAFPGAPILIGRQRLQGGALSAVVVNNKISNVCAPGGVETAERICAEVGRLLGRPGAEVFPSSTGVIGWRLPADAMVAALPAAVASLQGQSILPVAEAIMTTDLYPKIRRVELPGGGSIVGIAKGAGMIEPNLATMLVFILTDVQVGRAELRATLDEAVDGSFQDISIDSDTSVSDTVLLASSNVVATPDLAAFHAGVRQVCRALAGDVVRNGEGVHHVIRVLVKGAPSRQIARDLGKAVVNSPLFQCAVNGNDPNVGRLVCALGKEIGIRGTPVDPSKISMSIAGECIFSQGAMRLSPVVEERLVAHLKRAELYASVPPPDGMTFKPGIDFPKHEQCVEIEVSLEAGTASCEVLGTDRSHEYITENADYRS